MIGEEIQELSAVAVDPSGKIVTCNYHEDIEEGEWLMLFFYPADFTWVCPTELVEIKNKYDQFQNLNTSVWAISTDGIEVHKKWINQAFGSLPFPLLSDRNWNISSEFGCLNPAEGTAFRGTIIIDGTGVIRHFSINDNNVGRNIDELLRLTAAFQESDNSGRVAPCGWQPDDEMITPED